MHLPVNYPEQHEKGCASVAFAGRRRTFADAMYDAVRYENIAVLNDPIGEDDGSDENLVRHVSTLLQPASVPRRAKTKPTFGERPTDQDGIDSSLRTRGAFGGLRAIVVVRLPQ